MVHGVAEGMGCVHETTQLAACMHAFTIATQAPIDMFIEMGLRLGGTEYDSAFGRSSRLLRLAKVARLVTAPSPLVHHAPSPRSLARNCTCGCAVLKKGDSKVV